jgi:hypothetical protein
MAIMIEVLNKQQKVIERHKFASHRIGLGRAYDNDLILFDKHVSPHHAELVKAEDGVWHLHDLSSLNGSFTEPDKAIDGFSAVDSGQLCWLGEQALRIYDESHPVAPAQPYNRIEQRLSQFGHWGVVTALIALMMLLEVFSMWLEVPKQERNEWPRMLIGLPLMLIGMALWPSALAVWARINQHEARFFAQLGITFAFFITWTLLDGIFSVVNFSANGASILSWLHEVTQWLVLVLMLSANFYLALQISTLRKVLLATSIGFVIILQSLDTGLLMNEFRQMLPTYDSSLMPLSYYFNDPVSQAEFSESSVELFKQVDETRLEDLKESK